MAGKSRAKVRVRDTDLGWRKLRREVFKPGQHVTVGIHAAEDASDDGGIGNVGLMAIHEFGTDIAGPNNDITIPERSVIRLTIDENAAKYRAMINKLGKQIYATRITTLQALNILGLKVAADMRRTIDRTPGQWEALKPSTIASRKFGGSKPLLDLGELKKSIKHKVGL